LEHTESKGKTKMVLCQQSLGVLTRPHAAEPDAGTEEKEAKESATGLKRSVANRGHGECGDQPGETNQTRGKGVSANVA